MEFKSLEISWIFETDLTNMNAGEGSSNLKEIKTYNNGLPYISGQSMRHALREAMKRENKDAFKCTPEYPCGDIKNCWTCDLFGYLLPGDGAKRWSPIKAAPALGQIREPITTDLIFRMVEDIKCPNCGESIYPSTLVRCYPIGVIKMIDGGKLDEKIIAIPFDDPMYNSYKDISELPPHIYQEMQHFFSVYKALEDKQTAVDEVKGADAAIEIINKI